MKPNPIPPGPGQESVWDYPRPPRVEDSSRHIRVVVNGIVIAETDRAKRVLETSHPPVYYIPPDDVEMAYLVLTNQATWCEWKGRAAYYDLVIGEKKIAQAAWFYAEPKPGFEELEGYIAFYPGKMDACYIDDEQVKPQPGKFYGGWVTSDIVGPFKGEPGTWDW